MPVDHVLLVDRGCFAASQHIFIEMAKSYDDFDTRVSRAGASLPFGTCLTGEARGCHMSGFWGAVQGLCLLLTSSFAPHRLLPTAQVCEVDGLLRVFVLRANFDAFASVLQFDLSWNRFGYGFAD